MDGDVRVFSRARRGERDIAAGLEGGANCGVALLGGLALALAAADADTDVDAAGLLGRGAALSGRNRIVSSSS